MRWKLKVSSHMTFAGVCWRKMEDVIPYCASPILAHGAMAQWEMKLSSSVAITTCILSAFGSLLIILSYVCIRKVRSKAREILVHISVMDLIYTMANLIGTAINFNAEKESASPAYQGACKAQGWFAVYGTIGSVLWTISLAVYLYFKVITIRLQPRQRTMQLLVIGLYIVGYALPVAVACYFLSLGLIGFNKFLSSGWCTINVFDVETRQRSVLQMVIGYDMWMYLSLFLIPFLVIATKCIINGELPMKRQETNSVSPVKMTWKSVELKLMAIPIIFLLLRMWSMLNAIIMVYSDIYCWANVDFVKFVGFLAGIGDSGQGFCNFILFVALTRSVREFFIEKLRLFFCCCCIWRRRRTLLLADAHYHRSTPTSTQSSDEQN